MFSLLRSAARPATFNPALKVAGRRFVSTSPPHLRSRSWKSSAARWGIAIAGIYYYNTSPVFAEHPQNNLLNPNVDALEDDRESSLIDTLTASSRNKTKKNASTLQSVVESTSADDAMHNTVEPAADIPVTNASPAELEAEADQQGAFNPETGEINWDCPCLGGMAHGPCGPQFREAFSCFVYSTEEPKGMNCIDKFQNMQNCFREHPEHYKEELAEDEEEEMDIVLAQEKQELTRQIAERKAADKQAEGRLLDEPTLAATKKSVPKKTSTESKPSTSSAKKATKSQASAFDGPSSEPHPGMAEEHEVKNEGQKSQISREPQPPTVDSSSSTEDSLVPRAAHDAK